MLAASLVAVVYSRVPHHFLLPVFGYVLGSVTALVARLSDSSNRHDAKLKEVAEYLKHVHTHVTLPAHRDTHELTPALRCDQGDQCQHRAHQACQEALQLLVWHPVAIQRATNFG